MSRRHCGREMSARKTSLGMAAEAGRTSGSGLVDPFVKGPGEVMEGPVVLEVGRLVQEPRGRRASTSRGP